MRRLLPPLLAGLALLSAARAAEMPVEEIESSEGQWVFRFLPTAFQKVPLVSQTVITEMTGEGKKLEPPTRENPAYYSAQSGGLRHEGDGPSNSRVPTEAELEDTLRRALATNHFLPATPAHPASLLIVFHWGAHTGLDAGSAEITGTGAPDVGHRNLLSRAALIGGTKFAAELKVALEKQDQQDMVSAASGMPGLSPLWLFLQGDARARRLYANSQADCYYLVASAYDYRSAAQGQRRLMWRTKMTADSQGVAMIDTLPGLVRNASRYFGRDMPVAATIQKPVNRETSTRLGPLEVKEYIERPAPDKAPEPKEKP